MVVNRDPRTDIKREWEKKLSRPEEEQKEEILENLRKESIGIVCLAYIYARNFDSTGIDVTERLQTAEEQVAVFQKIYDEAYREGRIAGISTGKRYAYEELIEEINSYEGCGFVKDGCDYAVRVIKKHMGSGKEGNKEKKEGVIP